MLPTNHMFGRETRPRNGKPLFQPHHHSLFPLAAFLPVIYGIDTSIHSDVELTWSQICFAVPQVLLSNRA
jgi:hypothetical protein